MTLIIYSCGSPNTRVLVLVSVGGVATLTTGSLEPRRLDFFIGNELYLDTRAGGAETRDGPPTKNVRELGLVGTRNQHNKFYYKATMSFNAVFLSSESIASLYFT